MFKKSSIVFLMLFGLVIGAVGASGQEVVQSQTTGTVNAPAPLISSASVDASTIGEVNLPPGIKNIYVKKVQEALKSMGYFPSDLETTEYLGPKTKEAIINFQKSQGLPALGFFGQATRNALKKKLQEAGTGTVIDRNVDIVCMKTAVEKREVALLTAFDAYSAKLKTARETRKTDLLAAWSIQDAKERHTAIKAAWEKYRQAVKAATKEWNQSRRGTWTQFAQEARNCKASAVETQDLENVEVED